MRLVADESCDFAVVSGARSAGHDVISITERMPGAEDEQVIKLAATERRLLLTEDKDFGQLVPAGEIRDAVFIVLWRTGLQMPPAGRKKNG